MNDLSFFFVLNNVLVRNIPRTTNPVNARRWDATVFITVNSFIMPIKTSAAGRDIDIKTIPVVLFLLFFNSYKPNPTNPRMTIINVSKKLNKFVTIPETSIKVIFNIL